MKKIPLDILNPNVTIVVTILVYADPSSEEMSNTPVLNVSTDFLFSSKRFIFLVHSFIHLFIHSLFFNLFFFRKQLIFNIWWLFILFNSALYEQIQ